MKNKSEKIKLIEAIKHKADRKDMYKGWVRISEDIRQGIKNGSYIKLISNDKHN